MTFWQPYACPEGSRKKVSLPVGAIVPFCRRCLRPLLSRTEPNFLFCKGSALYTVPRLRAKFCQEEPNLNVNIWVILISSQTIILFCFTVGSCCRCLKVFLRTNYAVGKSPSYVQAIYSTIFKIKQKLGRHFHRIVAPLHSTIQEPSWSLQDLSKSKEHRQVHQHVREN